MVNPRPVTSRSTPGKTPQHFRVLQFFHWPLMNWRKKTRILVSGERAPWIQTAAVVLPLPLPVKTRVSP